MDCKEANKMISLFLNNDLNGRDIKAFMQHIANCPDCMEELSIQFLVLEGIASLENGNTFDLQKELNRQLEDTRRRMRIRTGFHYLVYGLEILVIITIIVLVIVL